MTDITKCVTGKCLRRETCYRFTAPADNLNQSWTTFTEDEGDDCPWFLPNLSG